MGKEPPPELLNESIKSTTSNEEDNEVRPKIVKHYKKGKQVWQSIIYIQELLGRW